MHAKLHPKNGRLRKELRLPMSLLVQSELLREMKYCVLNLQNWKILNPEDISVLRLRRVLREKINELEHSNPDLHHSAA